MLGVQHRAMHRLSSVSVREVFSPLTEGSLGHGLRACHGACGLTAGPAAARSRSVLPGARVRDSSPRRPEDTKDLVRQPGESWLAGNPIDPSALLRGFEPSWWRVRRCEPHRQHPWGRTAHANGSISCRTDTQISAGTLSSLQRRPCAVCDGRTKLGHEEKGRSATRISSHGENAQRRRRTRPMPARPMARTAIDTGSGTSLTVTLANPLVMMKPPSS